MAKIFTAVYRNWHPGYSWFERDSGLVTEGLRELGVESKLVILESDDLPNNDRFLPIPAKAFFDPDFWAKLNLDAVVLQGGGEAATQPVADAIHASGTKHFLRMDSDGVVDPWVNWRLYLKGKWWSSGNRARVRYLLWEELAWAKESSDGICQTGRPVSMGTTLERERFLLAMRIIRRPFFMAAIFLGKKCFPKNFGCGRMAIRLSKAEAILVESRLAAARIQRLLIKCGLQNQARNVIALPIPISMSLPTANDQPREKVVLTVGRLYDDQKDARRFVKLIARFLEIRKDYRAIAIGDGFRYVEHMVNRLDSSVKDRIQVLGRSLPKKIRSVEERSRIFICSSRGESMHIASAEAVCAGCSVVGPAEIASMQEYTLNQSGTVALTRGVNDLLDALLAEANEWDSGNRNPTAISEFYSNIFSPIAHAKQLVNLAAKN